MRLFAVRTIETQQPVGLFWAASTLGLSIMVDAVCDPGICEYRVITAETAIVWVLEENWKLGVKEIDDSLRAFSEQFEKEVERRENLVKANMEFDGPLAGDGTISDFLDGLSDVAGWEGFNAEDGG